MNKNTADVFILTLPADLLLLSKELFCGRLSSIGFILYFTLLMLKPRSGFTLLQFVQVVLVARKTMVHEEHNK